MAVMNLGDIASEFSGHTVIDRSLVFGFGPSPETTHFGGTEPMEKAMNAAWVLMEQPIEQYYDARLAPPTLSEEHLKLHNSRQTESIYPKLVTDDTDSDTSSESSGSPMSFDTCHSGSQADATGAEMARVDVVLQTQEAEMAAVAALEASYAEDARRAQLPTDGALLMGALREVEASGTLDKRESVKLKMAIPMGQPIARLCQFTEWE